MKKSALSAFHLETCDGSKTLSKGGPRSRKCVRPTSTYFPWLKAVEVGGEGGEVARSLLKIQNWKQQGLFALAKC